MDTCPLLPESIPPSVRPHRVLDATIMDSAGSSFQITSAFPYYPSSERIVDMLLHPVYGAILLLSCEYSAHRVLAVNGPGSLTHPLFRCIGLRSFHQYFSVLVQTIVGSTTLSLPFYFVLIDPYPSIPHGAHLRTVQWKQEGAIGRLPLCRSSSKYRSSKSLVPSPRVTTEGAHAYSRKFSVECRVGREVILSVYRGESGSHSGLFSATDRGQVSLCFSHSR